MNKALDAVAREISNGLALEISSHPDGEKVSAATIVGLLLQHLDGAVVRRLFEANSPTLSRVSMSPDLSGHHRTGRGVSEEERGLEERLERVEQKLERLAIRAQAGAEEAKASGESTFPNLKYAKPKYKNMESVLKYVEGEEEKGGVKLVIMNFND